MHDFEILLGKKLEVLSIDGLSFPDIDAPYFDTFVGYEFKGAIDCFSSDNTRKVTGKIDIYTGRKSVQFKFNNLTQTCDDSTTKNLVSRLQKENTFSLVSDTEKYTLTITDKSDPNKTILMHAAKRE